MSVMSVTNLVGKHRSMLQNTASVINVTMYVYNFLNTTFRQRNQLSNTLPLMSQVLPLVEVILSAWYIGGQN